MPTRYDLQSARPLTVSEARRRHANIASAYFNSNPSVGNIYNGVVNWLKSKQILTPDNTGTVTGAAPTAGRKIPSISRTTRINKTFENAFNEYKSISRVIDDSSKELAKRKAYLDDVKRAIIKYKTTSGKDYMSAKQNNWLERANIMYLRQQDKHRKLVSRLAEDKDRAEARAMRAAKYKSKMNDEQLRWLLGF